MGKPRKLHLGVLAAVLVVVLAPWPAATLGAATDPYAGDPLGLIPDIEMLREHTIGTDVWEVWVCDAADGTASVDLSDAVSYVNDQMGSYFGWLSESRYSPVFLAGGVYTVDRAFQCASEVGQYVSGTSNGVLIIDTLEKVGGSATAGIEGELFPGNDRWMQVNAGAVAVSPMVPQAQPSVVAHEIGHTIWWPHTFSGLTAFSDGMIWEYDNLMDVMSDAGAAAAIQGTTAINRYAAGWLPPTQVLFHRGGSFTYDLDALGYNGVQMLVLPTDTPGTYTVIGSRVLESFDSALPIQGIEVYDVVVYDLATRPLIRLYGRVSQNPAVGGVPPGGSLQHVHDVGSSFTVGGVTVSVLSRTLSGFSVRVEGSSVSERFLDDNGSLHEADIEAIALAGITLGCNPPVNDQYCPSQNVTRAEAATFLLRLIGESPLAEYRGYFLDVPQGQWYTGYVERAYELGITLGYEDGTFAPDGAVTRSETAALLLRALGEDLVDFTATGVFADVEPDAWYIEEVERLGELGITTGCSISPLRFCPNDSVKRDQMGSFLARAIGLQS